MIGEDPRSRPRKEGLSPTALHRVLLRLPPELAHDLAIAGLRMAQSLGPVRRALGRHFWTCDERLTVDLLGTRFPNPLGLAAGFDKDGRVITGMATLGFGFVEVGTVTPLGQKGNPKPRLFRHPEAASLENAMGFNNDGEKAIKRHLRRQLPATIPVGVNIGKNKRTPNERAAEDYQRLVGAFDELCDYFVVNVSSPNTPGLRELQEQQALRRILSLCRERTALPILVKLSPDLEPRETIAIAAGAVDAGAAGIIVTNTTTDYGLLASARRIGGLSGAILQRRSFEVLQTVAKELFGKCALVSVGGISSGREVYRRIKAGASLVQIYSAFAFEGPALLGRILGELLELAERDGCRKVTDAVGGDL